LCSGYELLRLRLFSFGGYGLALPALALVVFGAYDSYPPLMNVWPMCWIGFRMPFDCLCGGAFDSAKNHKRQRRKRQSVTAKQEKTQTPIFV